MEERYYKYDFPRYCAVLYNYGDANSGSDRMRRPNSVKIRVGKESVIQKPFDGTKLLEHSYITEEWIELEAPLGVLT